MYIKIHKVQERIILAICDENLLGRKFEENNHLLEVSERFYKGEKKSKEEIIDLIKDAHIINFVGEESVKLGIELNLINKNNILTVKGIPHAQTITI